MWYIFEHAELSLPQLISKYVPDPYIIIVLMPVDVNKAECFYSGAYILDVLGPGGIPWMVSRRPCEEFQIFYEQNSPPPCEKPYIRLCLNMLYKLSTGNGEMQICNSL